MDKIFKILVAEDEEYNFTLVKYILQKEGMEVLWAKNGEEALEFVKNKEHKIDLIMMDIKMPIMNGIDATKSIKKINSKIPIIAVTAYAMEEDREICLNAGCDEFITKPINKQHLLNITYRLIAD